ncbi:unnamed protein product [Brugia timori]|uniref:Uncharacterized protein n=1 Tax=Brugia timori TaxID=42155 RepID=A0A0R3QBF0_9BILA|nr:unnamed protein product [Brugia timori]
MSNSVELAPLIPQTFRANSITAHCIPRQIPKNGILFSRAYLHTAIFPSTPRPPNPPGTTIPLKLQLNYTTIQIHDDEKEHYYMLA